MLSVGNWDTVAHQRLQEFTQPVSAVLSHSFFETECFVYHFACVSGKNDNQIVTGLIT